MIKKISFEHWLGRQRDEAYKEGARVQAEMDAEAMERQRREIVEEIEKLRNKVTKNPVYRLRNEKLEGYLNAIDNILAYLKGSREK